MKKESYGNLETCKVVIGVTPGYFHNNENGCAESFFMGYFQGLLEKYCKENDAHLSFVVIPARVVYLSEYGCPPKGEEVYTLESTPDPKYVNVTDISMWKFHCKNFISQLAEGLEQSTVRIVFNNAYVYGYSSN